MRKALTYFLFVTVLLSLNALLNGQDTGMGSSSKERIINFSIYTGLRLTSFSGNESEFIDAYNSMTGFTFKERQRLVSLVGINANLNIAPFLTLKTGLMFSPKGMAMHDQITVDFDEYGMNVKFKVYYLEIPTLIELSTSTRKPTAFYVNGGISPAFLIDSKLKTEVWIIDLSPDASDQEDKTVEWDEVDKFDYSYIIGAGFKGKYSHFGLQYEKGTKTVSSTGWDFKNQAITLIL